MQLGLVLRNYRKNPVSVLKRLLKEHLRCRRALPADVYQEFRDKVRGNARFRGLHAGETIYILCTGPSIRDVPVEPLVGKTLISVSHFAQHPACDRLRPRYHMLAANHPPFGADHYDRYVRSLEAWDWPFTCLFGYSPYPHSILAHIATKGRPRFDHSFYKIDLNHFRQPEAFGLERAHDFSRSIPPSNTILVQAIQFALFTGARRIVLLGCDHDYMHHFGEPSIPHFYEADKGHDDSEHLKGINTERWFSILGARWAVYRHLREYGRARGVEILNATPGSKLDVFPLVDLGSVT